MEIHPLFPFLYLSIYYFISFLLLLWREPFGPIKRLVSFFVKMESFWAKRIFSPELIKKFIVEIFGHVGFFNGNLVFSQVVD